VLSGVVLAAGEARRMGDYLKALMPIEGSTFIERIVGTIARTGVGEIVVVLGFEQERIRQAAGVGEARFVVNEQWREGQLSSLRAAVCSLSQGSEGVLFTPVDHPLVQAATYGVLIEQWKRNPDRIVIPRFEGRKGHPAIFPSRLYGPLLHDELPGGARDLIYREMESVLFVTVSDPGVLQDIDTPDDYRQLIGDLP
jgi:molybdenum cofactor cytidylyltransferase